MNGFSPIVQHCSAVKRCAPYALFRVTLSSYVVVLQYIENIDFLHDFPLMDSIIGAFCWLFLWNFKE